MVLLGYIERVQEAGTQPPSDTGLTVMSWHGMYHGEMSFFHLSQWALWGRQPLAERCLGAWNVSAANACKLVILSRFVSLSVSR